MAEKRKVWRVKDASGAIEQVLIETSAEQVMIADSASNFTSNNVEGALAEVAEMAKTGGVTGVKGDAESTYRKGDVNITKANIGLENVTNDAQVKRSEMGVASGVATLNAEGKVPSSQLPSYVDDVLEYANKAGFPATGESGKIYVAKDTNLTYRWGGTEYVEISPSLALGENESTAYAGNKGKANADKIAEIINGPQAVKRASQADNATNATNATNADTAGKVAHSFTLFSQPSGSGSYKAVLEYDGSASKGFMFAPEFLVSLGGSNPILTLRSTGVTAGAYSAVTVDATGRVTAGGKSIEWGASGVSTPSNDLMVGGLFFELQ